MVVVAPLGLATQAPSQVESWPGRPFAADNRIDYSTEVDLYARRIGASVDVAEIAALALRHVPRAEKVSVIVVNDQEDGTTTLHFTVHTRAGVDEVIQAEDRLHEELFERVSPGKRSVFSIGYDFVR